jgi:hypothetical protein
VEYDPRILQNYLKTTPKLKAFRPYLSLTSRIFNDSIKLVSLLYIHFDYPIIQNKSITNDIFS